MFYNIVIYFSQLSYFVSNRSDESLREDLGRDKPRIFRILSIDLMSTRIPVTRIYLLYLQTVLIIAGPGVTI